MKTITISFSEAAYKNLTRAAQIGSRGPQDLVIHQIIESIDRGNPLHVFRTSEERAAERAARKVETRGVPVAPHGAAADNAGGDFADCSQGDHYDT